MPTTLIAQAPAPAPKNQKDIFKNADLLIWAGILAGALLVMAVIVFFVDRWRKRDDDGPTYSSTLQLTDYREMYENGEITHGEYERIRAKLAAKMKKEVGLTEAGGGNQATTPGPAEPPPAQG
jgi:hypothetical protein